MHLTKLIIFLLFVVICVSCRKKVAEFDGKTCSGNCFILSGQLIDTPSANKLSDVNLKFYFIPGNGLIFGGIPTYLGTTMTNSNGNYEFKFDASKYLNKKGFYQITFSKTGYFYSPTTKNDVLATFDLDSSSVNSPLIQNFILFKNAILKVHFIPTSTTNINFLNFQYNYGLGETGVLMNENQAIDTTISFLTAGDINSKIHWQQYLKNGMVNEMFDTIYIQANSEKYYEVKY